MCILECPNSHCILPCKSAESAKSVQSLASIPATNDSVLTAGVGQLISITCTHQKTITATTFWRISSSVVCSSAIVHVLAPESVDDCGPFRFVNVSQGAIPPYTSAAITNTTTSMTGAVVQCFDGVGSSPTQIGSNITLCVFGEYYYIQQSEIIRRRVVCMPPGIYPQCNNWTGS